jgi:potassium-transporting ATPase KdpC subunit
MRRQLLTSIAMLIVITLVCGLGYSLLLVGIGETAFGHQANGSFVQQGGRDVGSSLIGQAFTDKNGDPIAKYFQSRPSEAVTSAATDHITVGEASNLGPSNPLLIGFVPGVSTPDGKNGKPLATNPYRTPADPFCVPVDTTPAADPVTTPTPGEKLARNSDGTYVCDPDTVPERAIAYRQEFGLRANAPVPVDAVTASGSGLDPDISIANADLQAPTVAKARGLSLATVLAQVKAHTTGRSLGVLGDPGVNVLTLNLALDALPEP